MWEAIVLLFTEIAGYLHERARNYRLETLIQLHDNLATSRRGIALLVSGPSAPDESELQLASARLQDLRRLAAEFGDPETVHGAGGDDSGNDHGPGDDRGADPQPVG
jgi:hypothetical protein